MGTNYYLKTGGTPACPHCGHKKDEETLHIGKSSMGWCFSLHVLPELGINSLDDWIARWHFGRIVDEYGDVQTPERMLDVIANRKRPLAWKDRVWRGLYTSEADFHRANSSERGPNNLLRHKVDGRHCIGQGAGTWDLIAGEFC